MGDSLEGSLRQVLCSMALLGYHLFVSYVIGHGEGDLELCDRIIQKQLKVILVFILSLFSQSRRRNNLCPEFIFCSVTQMEFGSFSSRVGSNMSKVIWTVPSTGIQRLGTHSRNGYNFIISATGSLCGLTRKFLQRDHRVLNLSSKALPGDFISSFKQDWYSARDFADLLFHESRWSKAIYAYQKASFMCMIQNKLEPDAKQELIQLFK